MMIRFALIILMWLITFIVEADYLEIRRSSNLKQQPESNSVTLYKLLPGEMVVLLDEDKQYNGYYHVETRLGVKGYVYRTLVRRFKGNVPPLIEVEADFNGGGQSIGQIPVGYYKECKELDGEKLKTQLHLLVRDHQVYTYKEVWGALEATDQSPVDAARVVLLYTGRHQLATQRNRGTHFDYVAAGYTLSDSWNREHVWPKSHGFPNKKDTAYTDLHHLRPADTSVNSARNSRSFDICHNQYFDNGGMVETNCFKEDWNWEPPENVKGDIARMLFYMVVRYEYGQYDLELVNDNPAKHTKEPILGNLEQLLIWHKEDPVDNYERRRNHVIWKDYQGNRNPFIDHPEYVELIWN